MLEDNSKASHQSAASLKGGGLGLLQRIVFRFTFCYGVLYCLPVLLNGLPVGGVTEPLDKLLGILCPWVAINVFHLTGPSTHYHPTGSGDTVLLYIQSFCFLIISAFVALVWSAFDRFGSHDGTLNNWLRTLVRFTLASTLLAYGFLKVFPVQFPAPDFTRLTESYGESSPMGLLWTFMGASPSYEVFCGSAEVASGLLLLLQRTSTLGAAVSGAVLLNVVVLNFCFDVPVKLWSVHLLMMSVFLLVPQLKAIWDFFVLHRSAHLKDVSIPRWGGRWGRVASVVLTLFVALSILIGRIWEGYSIWRPGVTEAAKFQQSSIAGVWDVDGSEQEFHNDDSASKGIPWRRVMLVSDWLVGVRTSEAELLWFRFTLDEKKHSFRLDGWRNEHTVEFSYQRPDKTALVLVGQLDHKPLSLRLHRYDPPQFRLKTRGFHWISEDPFNI